MLSKLMHIYVIIIIAETIEPMYNNIEVMRDVGTTMLFHEAW